MIRAPLLDDVDFEALFEEARALIPRFAPEWTDHNFHDPGITLIDLLAWIADMQIYRVGFVGDRHRAAFAALLGIAPRHAAPAHGLIWPEGAIAPGEVDGDSRVAAADAPDLPFRLILDGPVHIGAARLAAVAIEAPAGGETAIAADEPIPLTGGARLRLGFDGPLAPPGGGRVTLGIALSDERTAAPEPGPALEVEHRADDGSGWQFASVADDGTAGLSRTGIIAIDIPPGPSAGAETLRLRLPAYLPAPAAIVRLALGVLAVEQVERTKAQALGTGNGLPDQGAAIDLAGLLGAAASGHPLGIVTDEEGGPAWTEVDDLAGSGPDDRHFVREARAGGIRFGNGVNGRVPPDGAQIAVRDLVRTRGAAGNLGEGRAWRVTTSTGTMAAANPAALSGGRDAEAIEDRIERMRLRALGRTAMITDADMCAAALDLHPLGIGQADVLAGVWPPLPGRRVCAARTLVVRTVAGRPPNDHVDAIAAALAPRRALGERLTVVAPRPVPIAVTVSVVVAGGKAAAIEGRIAEALAERLSDRAGGAGGGRDPWPAGRPVTSGEIEALIASIDEVRSIPSVALARAGEALGPGPVALGPVEVAVLDRARLAINLVGGSA